MQAQVLYGAAMLRQDSGFLEALCDFRQADAVWDHECLKAMVRYMGSRSCTPTPTSEVVGPSCSRVGV